MGAILSSCRWHSKFMFVNDVVNLIWFSLTIVPMVMIDKMSVLAEIMPWFRIDDMAILYHFQFVCMYHILHNSCQTAFGLYMMFFMLWRVAWFTKPCSRWRDNTPWFSHQLLGEWPVFCLASFKPQPVKRKAQNCLLQLQFLQLQWIESKYSENAPGSLRCKCWWRFTGRLEKKIFKNVNTGPFYVGACCRSFDILFSSGFMGSCFKSACLDHKNWCQEFSVSGRW